MRASRGTGGALPSSKIAPVSPMPASNPGSRGYEGMAVFGSIAAVQAQGTGQGQAQAAHQLPGLSQQQQVVIDLTGRSSPDGTSCKHNISGTKTFRASITRRRKCTTTNLFSTNSDQCIQPIQKPTIPNRSSYFNSSKIAQTNRKLLQSWALSVLSIS